MEHATPATLSGPSTPYILGVCIGICQSFTALVQVLLLHVNAGDLRCEDGTVDRDQIY